jgi:drug/metabolite transporter (DMT)-like permease
MVDLVLGIVAAVGASALYSLGIALQAMDAKQAPAHEHLRVALVWNLLRRARWLAGTGLSMLGWPLQVVALLLAPLVVVQPTLAAGLVVLMVFAERLLNERAGLNEHLATGAIVIGVLGVALAAPPRGTFDSSQNLTITLVLVSLGTVSLVPYLFRAIGRTSPAIVTMVGAGLAFAWSALATKLASVGLEQGHLGIAAAWGLSTAAASGVGVLSEMSALQQRPAIQVAPLVFVTQTVVPVTVAFGLLGEPFSSSPLVGAAFAASLALLLVGAALLARSPLLLALVEGEPVSHARGSTRSPSAPSLETIRTSPATEELDPSASTTTTSPARVGR